MDSETIACGDSLSDRERQVLGLLAEGYTYQSIARRMQISPHTVDTYLRRIRGKTGVRSRAHLLRLAIALDDSTRLLGAEWTTRRVETDLVGSSR
ncbi:helix-turn-helix transcriptional regulator [Kitasatospora sp. NPDC052896]|uniref:helix-turn-helix transcriptional regulator n=1 Tax=Kitasatospora sp. NPDC052896 TaxID=3364061 RepID=UPI0037C641ED